MDAPPRVFIQDNHYWSDHFRHRPVARLCAEAMSTPLPPVRAVTDNRGVRYTRIMLPGTPGLPCCPVCYQPATVGLCGECAKNKGEYEYHTRQHFSYDDWVRHEEQYIGAHERGVRESHLRFAVEHYRYRGRIGDEDEWFTVDQPEPITPPERALLERALKTHLYSWSMSATEKRIAERLQERGLLARDRHWSEGYRITRAGRYALKGEECESGPDWLP